METQMSRRTISWRQLAAVGAILLLGACAQQQTPVASNPPPVAPGPHAVWYTVSFATGSYAIDGQGRKVIREVVAYMQHNPGTIATIIGRTDTVGSKDFNMHLSHRRADACATGLSIMAGWRWTGSRRAGPARPGQTCR